MSTEQNTIKKLKHELKEKDKEISRLKKELRRRDDVSEDYHALLDEVDDTDRRPTGIESKSDGCPKCFALATKTNIGKFVLVRCTNCDWRQRK